MNKTIDINSNQILYPFYNLLQFAMHVVFYVLILLSPSKYKKILRSYENNQTLNNVIGLVLFNALGGFLLMATNIKLANVLGPAVFGLFSYYCAIGDVGGVFVRYGRDKTMTRDLIQKPDSFNYTIINTSFLSILNLFVFVLLICLFSGSLDMNIDSASLFIIIGTCLVSLDLQPVYESVNFISWHSLYNIVQRFLFMILIWAPLMFVNSISLVYLGYILFATWLFVIFIQYKEIFFQFKIKINKAISLKEVSNLYKSNFLIALSCMLGVAFGPIIRLVLKEYVDETAVGLYSACFQIFLISKFLLTQIARVGNPMMAEAGKNDCKYPQRIKFIRRYCVIMLIVTCPFVIPMLFMPGYITDFCFSEDYYDIRFYIPLFGIYLLSMSIGNVFEQFLISVHKDNLYFSIYTFCALLTVLMSFLLIPYYGVLGATLSFVCPNFLARLSYSFAGLYILRDYKKKDITIY